MDQPVTRLNEILDRIAAAAQVARRTASDVTLIAISKTHAAERITPLIEAGQRVFGENRVQEAAEKWPGLRAMDAGIELHLVGQLQSNKAEDAVRLFDCIHSLDRSSLVAALARMEIKLTAQEIIRRLDNIRLAIPVEQLTYLPTLASHTLERLPLTFTRRAG